MKIFVRQCFTQADKTQSEVVQQILDNIRKDFPNVKFLTGDTASDSSTFRDQFEQDTGLDFTAANFRRHRLNLIDACDAMLVIRTAMSESGAFELAYNCHREQPKPVFFAYSIDAPIRTTLLRELAEDYPVTYQEFITARDIKRSFHCFMDDVEQQRLKSLVPPLVAHNASESLSPVSH